MTQLAHTVSVSHHHHHHQSDPGSCTIGCDIIRNCFPPTSEREQNLVENTTTSRHIVMDDNSRDWALYHGGGWALWSGNNYRSQTPPDGLVPHRLIAVEDLVIKLI